MEDLLSDMFLNDFLEELMMISKRIDTDNIEVTSTSAPIAKRAEKEKEDIVSHLEGIGEDETWDSMKVVGQIHMHMYDRLTLFKELTTTHVARLKSLC